MPPELHGPKTPGTNRVTDNVVHVILFIKYHWAPLQGPPLFSHVVRLI